MAHLHLVGREGIEAFRRATGTALPVVDPAMSVDTSRAAISAAATSGPPVARFPTVSAQRS